MSSAVCKLAGSTLLPVLDLTTTSLNISRNYPRTIKTKKRVEGFFPLCSLGGLIFVF